MNKGLAWFLAFLSVLLLLLAGTAWFLGWNVLAFIFHEQRNDAPVVMVGLFDFADSDAQRRFIEDYAGPTRELVGTVGGRQVWGARTEELLTGNAGDLWPLIGLTEYPSRARFIDLATSSDYRAGVAAREALLSRTAMYAATPRSAFVPDRTRTYVARFTELEEDTDYQRFEETWGDQERELLGRHRGKLAWAADLNPLVAGDDDAFDRLTLITFPTAREASAWALDPERETLASLEQRLLTRDVMLLARTAAELSPDTP